MDNRRLNIIFDKMMTAARWVVSYRARGYWAIGSRIGLAWVWVACAGVADAVSWGPVWSGPAPVVEWLGMSPAKTQAPTAAEAPVARTPDVSATPRWVGYVKRNRDEWWFRLILADGRSEMIKRGGSSSDGWLMAGYQAQANRPSQITLKKDGKEETLQLTPEGAD